MFIDGSVITLCTLPGILVHQFFYLLACKYYGIEHAFAPSNFTLFLSPKLVVIGEADSEKLGKKLERLAMIGSALACALLGGLNQFTPKGSVVEGLVVWVAISIGVQSFPLANVPGGKIMKFIWLDALYGMFLYFVGKYPYALFVSIGRRAL